MKTWSKVLIGVVSVVVLLIVGVYLAVKIALPPEKVKAWIAEDGSRILNRSIVVGDISIAVFPTIRVAAQNVELANRKGFSNDPLFSAKEIGFAVDFWSVVQLSPVVKSIVLVEPNILFEVNQDGENNLAGLGKPEEVGAGKSETSTGASSESEPSTKLATPGTSDSTKSAAPSIPIPLDLQEFRLENARVRYLDQSQQRNIVLGAINQTAAVSADSQAQTVRLQGVLNIAQIQVSDAASGVQKGDVRFSVNHNLLVNLANQTLTLNQLELGVQELAVNVSGTIQRLLQASPQLDLTFATNTIGLPTLIKEVPPGMVPALADWNVTGSFQANGSVAGAVGGTALPKLKASLTLNDIAAVHQKMKVGLEGLKGAIHITENSAELADLQFQLGQQPITLSAFVSELQPMMKLDRLQLKGVANLEQTLAMASQFATLPEGFSALGTINLDIQGKGVIDPQKPQLLKMQGAIDMENLMVSAPALPKSLQAQGQIQFNNDRITTNMQTQIGESDLSVSGNIRDYLAMALPDLAQGKRTRVNFSLNSNRLNLDELMPPSPETEVAEAAPAGTEAAEAPPMEEFPALPEVDATINTQFKQVDWKGLTIRNLTSKAGLKNNVLDADMKGQLYSGRFQQTVRVDLKDRRNAKIKGGVQLKSIEANDFISRFNDLLSTKNELLKSLAKTDDTLFGKLSLDVDMTTQGLPHTFMEQAAGNFSMRVFDGKLAKAGLVEEFAKTISQLSSDLDFEELNFQELFMAMEVKDQKVHVKDLKLNLPALGLMDFQGTVGFDGKLDLPVAHRLQKEASQALLGVESNITSQLANLVNIPELKEASLMPQDDQGRALLYYQVTGSASSPKFSLDSKRMKGAVKSQTDKIEATLRAQEAALKQKLEAEKQRLEAEARAKIEAEKKRLEAEKKRLEAEARARVEAEKKRLEAEAKKKAEKEKKRLEKEVKKKAEDLLKNLKF